jgi:hypothetical protein
MSGGLVGVEGQIGLQARAVRVVVRWEKHEAGVRQPVETLGEINLSTNVRSGGDCGVAPYSCKEKSVAFG